ncbi:MAG TPA: histidine kinase [Candidatus Binataceae bacterium]|nr:histidine kinase [Candidatus Binataceae bacterium]
MKSPDFGELDRQVARARLVLSLLAIATLYIDPSDSGIFRLSGAPLAIMLAHLAFSLGNYFGQGPRSTPTQLKRLTTVLDLAFAAAIALATEGATSPSYVFFVFAIVAAGFRSGFRATVVVTIASVMLYLIVIGLMDGVTNLYMMRSVYLAIAGYLICFFGQQRASFEARLREVESRAERLQIARSLHDGYIQSLAALSLRLKACGELLRRHEAQRALGEMAELQVGVAREYDAIRSYLRSLVESDGPAVGTQSDFTNARFDVKLEFSAGGLIAEQILQIALEGMRNAWRHSKGKLVKIEARRLGGAIQLTVSDDGVGFVEATAPPWTIASRVAQYGGELRIAGAFGAGVQLEIQLPADPPPD